ncbi:hypothetical protein ATCC90586_004463 [Pythium insidiosum]|nr:hypothetical protein ATCC90586_004463 [Pythium insidiosum]
MYTLTVTLHRAEDLPSSDYGFMGIGGKSDPYFVFKVGRVTHKSSVQHSTLSPTWTPPESFTFHVDNPKEQCLEVWSYDWDRFNKDDLLGTRSIPLLSFLDRHGAETIAYDLDVQSEYDNQKRQSVMYLSVELKSNDNADSVLELWENQRYHVVDKWTTKTYLPNDRKRWSSVDDSSVSSDNFTEVEPKVPSGLVAEGWTLDVSQGDANGWLYAVSFQGPWQKNEFTLATARRRKWINRCTRAKAST